MISLLFETVMYLTCIFKISFNGLLYSSVSLSYNISASCHDLSFLQSYIYCSDSLSQTRCELGLLSVAYRYLFFSKIVRYTSGPCVSHIDHSCMQFCLFVTPVAVNALVWTSEFVG